MAPWSGGQGSDTSAGWSSVKLQKLDYLAITGVMWMIPPTTMEVLLGLPPLHVITEAEAQAGMYRLMYHQQ